MRILLLSLLAAFSILPAGYPPGDLDLDKGKFLIATEKLMDPRFQQSVILLIQYNNEGAMGLIINHPTKLTASSALPDVQELKRSSELLHVGGPVSISSMLFLFRSSGDIPDAARIFDHVYFGNGTEALQQRIQQMGVRDRYRIYAGYAGWSTGQLELEIQTGHWFVWHADAEMIFEKSSKDIWPEMIRRTSVMVARNNDQSFRFREFQAFRAFDTKSFTFR